MDMGLAFGGSVFIETAFQLPGMGQVLYRALTTDDLPVIMGVVLIVAVAVTIANTIADILYWAIDPRLGLRRRREKGLPTALPRRPWARQRIKESPT
jgi:peptide/nickel transport system permease protein